MEVCFIFIVLSSLIPNGVFGDEVKSVSVMEGNSVTLHNDVIKQRDDLIVWSYGPEHTFVSRIKGKADSTSYSDDERFRDRVMMNDQTGDLIITHITSQHSGLYTLKISRNKKLLYKTFNLTIYARPVSNQTHLHIRDDCDTCAAEARSPSAPPTSAHTYSPVLQLILIPLMSLLCLIPFLLISLRIYGFIGV